MRKGLLFAGTEVAVFVSFNDGDDWQPLRLNMPATSIRDLVLHDDDIVVATHGRSIWILDDLSPLRQLTAETHLYAPRVTYRLPRNTNTDTPMPPEEPVGKNPPDGAILYYNLKTAEPVSIEILDAGNRVVRRFSSEDQAPPPDPTLDVPTYWLRPFLKPATDPGMHRLVWDLHGPPAPGGSRRDDEPPISAIVGDTPVREGEWMPPGEYQVKLTANGQTFTQPLSVKPDPRR